MLALHRGRGPAQVLAGQRGTSRPGWVLAGGGPSLAFVHRVAGGLARPWSRPLPATAGFGPRGTAPGRGECFFACRRHGVAANSTGAVRGDSNALAGVGTMFRGFPAHAGAWRF